MGGVRGTEEGHMNVGQQIKGEAGCIRQSKHFVSCEFLKPVC